MNHQNLASFVRALEEAGELLRITQEVDPKLEISEIYLRQAARSDGGKALLFEKVKGSQMPVLINAFGSFKRLHLAFGGRDFESFQEEILSLSDLSVPDGFKAKLHKLWTMKDLPFYLPRKVNKAPCQEVILKGRDVDLSLLPVLTCWPLDGGPFITLPLVFTRSLDGRMRNMGMYRMQIYDRQTTGMHWQIHKDGSHFFSQYRKANQRMEAAVVIGASPILTYCATAPLPPGLYELIFAGFLAKEAVRTVKCLTVDLEVPAEAEIVLEGYLEPSELRPEGPFGDHTGYYTPIDPYPVFHVTAMTMRKNAIYQTTVVGRSPMEDCYLAHATERLFLPLLQRIAPEVLDQHLPWDGNFHNCQIFNVEKEYPFQARRLMSHIWGFSQASFCKMIITASKDAPIHRDQEFLDYFLNHLDIRHDLFFTEGIVDALDHSAPQPLYGSKIGIDITHPIEGEPGYGAVLDKPVLPHNLDFLDKDLGLLDSSITGIHAYGLHLNNPVLVIRINKSRYPYAGQKLAQKIFERSSVKFVRIFVLVDEKNSDLKEGHKILWRLFNNIDGRRDVIVSHDRLLVDATYKIREEGFNREWPPDCEMSEEIIKKVDSILAKPLS